MYKIGKTIKFAAAHHLPQLPEDHKCRRDHGHNYEVYVELQGDLNENGFVMDYGEIKDIIMQYDHQDLNEMVDFHPTAEHLAAYFWELIEDHCGDNVKILHVRVKETDDSFAEFTNR
jgi:6-pyruvoyltetrahydropterin/6-carboxytetrahydropterin synthase